MRKNFFNCFNDTLITDTLFADTTKMKLALETSTNVCSVAFCDSVGEMYEKRTDKRGSHSEQLFLFIKELMAEHNFKIGDLSEVLISEGPGSYTGLRIGASAVKGLLFQTGVKLMAVNTLASFAASAVQENPDLRKIHAIIDARRVHVYHREFRFEKGTLLSDDNTEVIPIEKFEDLVKPGDGIIGTGLKRLDRKVLEQSITYDSAFISALSLIRLNEIDANNEFITQIDPKTFEPKYYTSGQG